jgi:hypothetical protein
MSVGAVSVAGSWQTEYSQLAKYTLQACPTGQLSNELCESLLTALRLAGDDDSVKQCARKLLMAGPQDAVRGACTSINLLDPEPRLTIRPRRRVSPG